jgi:hypothetical protein
MKHMSFAILIFCASMPAAASAQEKEIGSAGTANYIARFSGTHRLSNSTIYESPNGNIGIGSTAPTVPLYVFSSNPVGPVGYNPITMWVESSADNAQGAVYGVSSSPVGGIGINGVAYGGQGNGVLGNFTSSTSGGGGGVIGLTSATSGFSYGARGDAVGTTGTAIGVFGQSYSADGGGGYFQTVNTVGGIGVTGVSYATGGFPIGVRGLTVATTGGGAAVFGVASSPNSFGAMFVNEAGGTILQGSVGPAATARAVFRVDSSGRVYADGGFQPSGADFAESMAATGDRSKYAAGDLLVIDPTANRHVALAQQPYSTLVAGIYSTKPGMLGTTRALDESSPADEIPLAVVGIVPCKVSAENGPIQVGDLLVASSTPGHAMKGTDRNRMLGAVVAKALEPLPKSTGVIQVLVTLQ